MDKANHSHQSGVKRRGKYPFAFGVLVFAALAFIPHLHAQQLQLQWIYSFVSSNGVYPNGLLQASDGSFYGTTQYGGTNGDYGTVFKVTAGGNLTTLVSFASTNGRAVSPGIIKGSDGSLYGTTEYGGTNGYGTVFRVTTNGTLTTLVSFSSGTTNGANPECGVVQGNDGNFYGTTFNGGSAGNSGYGTVFKVTTNGALTTLVSFTSAGVNGQYPIGGLIQGSDGWLYGTAYGGGSGNGTVFKISTDGTFTTLVLFTGANGANPRAALVQGSDGSFYGTTQHGGTAGNGTVFKITTNGVLTTLVSFVGTNGANPFAALIQGGDQCLYGTTYWGGISDYGTVFKVTTNGTLTRLVSFANNSNGKNPVAGLVQGGDGSFYGTTEGGSAYGNYGTIFRLAPPPVHTATATATVINGFVVGVTITDSGGGYTAAPVVHITGGGGSGAQATATVSNGVVVAITMIYAGSGYTSVPTITISPPVVSPPRITIQPLERLQFSGLTPGTNYQLQSSPDAVKWLNVGSLVNSSDSMYSCYAAPSAQFRLAQAPVPSTATAVPQITNGFVFGISVTGGGFGYLMPPTVLITGGGGNGAQATASISNQVLSQITVVNPGFGYVSSPTIMIDPPQMPVTALAPTVMKDAMRIDYTGLTTGLSYHLQNAATIPNWINFGDPFSATTQTNSLYLDMETNAHFFQLHYEP